MEIASWSTRTLATFIAAGYMVDPKDGNPALDEARKIAIDEIEKEQLLEAEEYIKKNPVVKEAGVGSFERFMGSFGSPGAWRG